MKSSLKLLSLILALACVLLFAVACTDDGDDNSETESPVTFEADDVSKSESDTGSSSKSPADGDDTPDGGDDVSNEYSNRYPSNSFVDFSQN